MDTEEKQDLQLALANVKLSSTINDHTSTNINEDSYQTKFDTTQSETIDVISFCIEEIIDSVQENSAVIVAVNEAISAVDEETLNELLSDPDISVSENIKDNSVDLTTTNKDELNCKDDKLVDKEDKSSNEVKVLKDKLTDDSTKCFKNIINEKNEGIQELDANGKRFKCSEVIIFSNDTEEEVKSKTLPVTLLSVSKTSSDQIEIKDNNEENTNDTKSKVSQNKNSKMKKLKRNVGGGSRFRLGSIFGIGNHNVHSESNTKEALVTTNPRYSSLDLCDSSYSSLALDKQPNSVSNEPYNQVPKYHKSTASLVKRSASKLSLGGVGGANAYSCSQARSQHVKNQHNSSYQTLFVPDGTDVSLDTTPVLLAVRKRASSDSKPGLFSYGNNSSITDDSNYYSSNSSKNCSPCANPKNKNAKQVSDYHQPPQSSSKLGFLKIFNKSLHALHSSQQNPSTTVDHGRGNLHKEASRSVYNARGGTFNTLQNQKNRTGGSRVHPVNSANSNSPTSRRTRTLPVEALSSERPLYPSDLRNIESINSSAPVPRPVLPQKRISSNTSATFNAREHLMFMLRRRRKGGKYSPGSNNNNDYEDIIINRQNKNHLGISPMNVSTSEQTSSSMSSINSTNDRRPRGGNNRYPHHSNVPINSIGHHQVTIRPQVHHPHSLNDNSRGHHLPVHSSSSTNSVNSTTSSTERNSGAETEESGGIESINGNGSNYDSGAFSRTSSPADEIEGPPGPPPRLASAFRKVLQHSHSHSDILSSSASFRQNLSRLNPNHASTAALIEQMRTSLSASMSRLALEVEPLNAPALVMAALGDKSNQHHQNCCINDSSSNNCWRMGHKNKCSTGCEKEDANINPSLLLACLNAASESSSVQQSYRGESVDSGVVLQSPSGARYVARNGSIAGVTSNGFIRGSHKGEKSGAGNDVSVTVGANTMLTISNTADKMPAGLRRSRSGLPMLGMSGLMTMPLDKSNYPKTVNQSSIYTSSLPKHGIKSNNTPSKKRNRISTVYLQGNSPNRSADQNVKSIGCETLEKKFQQKAVKNSVTKFKEGLERSDSLVTVMGATVCSSMPSTENDQLHCNCQEKVTVNGQHLHCPSTSDGRHPLSHCQHQEDNYMPPPQLPPKDYPDEYDSVQYSPSLHQVVNGKERRPIRDEDEVFRFDPTFHSALANDCQHYQPVLVDRSTNTSNRITPVSMESNHENNDVADDYAIRNNFSASNSEASQTQPNSLIII